MPGGKWADSWTMGTRSPRSKKRTATLRTKAWLLLCIWIPFNLEEQFSSRGQCLLERCPYTWCHGAEGNGHVVDLVVAIPPKVEQTVAVPHPYVDEGVVSSNWE